MTNLQLLLTIGIPTLAVILSILNNNARFASIESRLTAIEADLRQFFQILGQHGEAIQTLKERVK